MDELHFKYVTHGGYGYASQASKECSQLPPSDKKEVSDLVKAAKELGDFFLGHAGVHGVGIAEDCVIIYTAKRKLVQGIKALAEAEVPNVTIKVKFVGKPKPA
jgi:hypothetical protein